MRWSSAGSGTDRLTAAANSKSCASSGVQALAMPSLTKRRIFGSGLASETPASSSK